MDIRMQKGLKQEGDCWLTLTRMPVAWRRYRGDACGHERDAQLHRDGARTTR